MLCLSVSFPSPMAETTKSSPPKPAKKSSHHQRQRTSRSKHKRRTGSQLPPAPPPRPPLHPWTAVRRFSCSGSLCRDTRVMHRPESSLPEASRKWVLVSGCNDSAKRSLKVPLKPKEANRPPQASSSSSSNIAVADSGSLKGRNLRRFSGCYECRMVVDPIHGAAKSYALRNSIFPCPHCGHIFAKSDALELHQTVRHAVSELGPEDTSRNIVEIIFQSSWLKKEAPVCKIDRILKVHNSLKTIAKFEDYRDSIKSKANRLPKKHPRCVADGNELLRFHCISFACSLGMNGSTNICNSIPNCNVCNIIKNGFKVDGVEGICTTATSGKAHDNARVSSEDEKRAMLVCRVIAGRVKKGSNPVEEFDSVSSSSTCTGGIYSNLDELRVFNPKAILPCFVVIYRDF